MEKINIAIDGPSGAGKSTISREIARQKGYIYLDTGALYRAAGLFVKNRGIDKADTAAIAALAGELSITLGYENGLQRVFLNGEDVTGDIRTPDISMYASAVSAVSEVRAALLSIQRDIAAQNDVIMDGRDIGTVVLPHAQVKIFLTASPECRAERRLAELLEKGEKVTLDAVLSDMKTRDANDARRAVAPLKPADDAVILDTTGNDFAQSVAAILKIIEEKSKHVL